MWRRNCRTVGEQLGRDPPRGAAAGHGEEAVLRWAVDRERRAGGQHRQDGGVDAGSGSQVGLGRGRAGRSRRWGSDSRCGSGEWEVVQGYNTGTHTNRSDFAQYKYSLDWARVDGDTAGQPVFAPVSGTVQWVDRGSGGMLVDAGNGYAVAVFHVTLDRDLTGGATVERGQRIGTISGPGGDGFMSMAHIDITVWQLSGRGHESVPFVGPNAIAGQEFPDIGGANQHMGTTVKP